MKALVLFSGGVDSTTCLGLAVKKYGADNVTALSVSYGQKHIKEIEAAAAITKYYGTERIELDLSLIFQYSDCSLLKNSEQNIPHESYSEQLKKDKRLYCFNLCSLQKRIVSGFCGKYCAIQKMRYNLLRRPCGRFGRKRIS